MRIYTPPIPRFSGKLPESKTWKQEVLEAREKGQEYLPDEEFSISIKYKGPFYRFIGQAELDKLIVGQRVSSPLHEHARTDITNKPGYLCGMYGNAKYRIQFKETDKFDPGLNTGSEETPHTVEKNEEAGEYYLEGFYSIEDIEKIDKIDNGNLSNLTTLDLSPYRSKPVPREDISSDTGSSKSNPFQLSSPASSPIPASVEGKKTNINLESPPSDNRNPSNNRAPSLESLNPEKDWKSLTLREKNKENWERTRHKKAFYVCSGLSLASVPVAIALGPLGLFMAPVTLGLLTVGLLPTLKAILGQEIKAAS